MKIKYLNLGLLRIRDDCSTRDIYFKKCNNRQGLISILVKDLNYSRISELFYADFADNCNVTRDIRRIVHVPEWIT